MQMRKYQPIWEQIKRDTTAQLVADIRLHDRIINGVRKEKARDLGWKLELSEQGTPAYELNENIEGKLITFYLVANRRNKLTNL